MPPGSQGSVFIPSPFQALPASVRLNLPLHVTHPGWDGRAPYLAWKEFNGLETTGNGTERNYWEATRKHGNTTAAVCPLPIPTHFPDPQPPPLSLALPPNPWGPNTSILQTSFPSSPARSLSAGPEPAFLSLTDYPHPPPRLFPTGGLEILSLNFYISLAY